MGCRGCSKRGAQAWLRPAGGATATAACEFPVVPRLACLAEEGDTTYQSPILHHVLLRGLEPGATYFYSVGKAAAGRQGSVC